MGHLLKSQFMKERVLSVLTFLIFILTSVISVLISNHFFPLYSNETAFSLGFLSSYLETLFDSFFPFFVKIAAAASLFFLAKKDYFAVFASLVVTIILPSNADILLLPLILLSSFSNYRISLISSFLFAFFSRLAIPAIIVSFILRIIFTDKKYIYTPFFGFLSPPLIGSIFQGNIFFPFFLSISSLPDYMPIKLFSPLFFLFSFSLFLTLLNRKKTILKIIASSISYFFNPLSFVPFLSFLKEKESLNKKWTFLFILPLSLLFVFPSEKPSFPKGAIIIFEKVTTSGFSVFVPPEIYFEAKEKLDDKNLTLKPELVSSQLLEYYKEFPLNPPLIGYISPEADLILTRGNYPKNHNLREIKKGYKLLWCGKVYALFAKEEFLKNENIEPLKHYTPYTLLPQDDEGKKIAISEIDKILIDEPDFCEALRDKGRLLIDLKREEEAIECFKKALKLKKNGELYNDLAVCYFNLQKYEEALNCYYEAIKLLPSEIIPRMGYAYTAITIGNLDDAILVLQDLNRAYPTFYPAYRLHYQAWSRKGEIEKAKEILRYIPKELRTPDENDLLGEK